MIFNIGSNKDWKRFMPRFSFNADGTVYTNNGEVKTEAGVYELAYEGDSNGAQNWNLKLLRSGTLSFMHKMGTLQAFVVGGGSGGSNASQQANDQYGVWIKGGKGGNGGARNTGTVAGNKASYTVTIGAGGNGGAAGGSSVFDEISAAGGAATSAYAESSYGSNGEYPFGSSTYGVMYGAGGGDGYYQYTSYVGGEPSYHNGLNGGWYGGGKGGDYGQAGGDGAANTGAAGGGTGWLGGSGAGGKGGSGIVIVRNAR